MLWVIYQLIFQKDELNSYLFIAIASISLWNIDIYIELIFVSILFFSVDKIEKRLDKKQLFYVALISIFMFFLFGNVFGLIYSKIMGYMDRGVTDEGLHFYQVIQTVREAGSISWETVANRVVGGFIPLAIGVMGYILLVIKHRAFLIALPLIGIGVFAHWAGLRFTVYAVSVASFAVVYFFWVITAKFMEDKKAQIVSIAILTAGVIYPNIMHIIGYKVPTVMNKMEVSDLDKLNKMASSKDYTLTWWDYGYPIWFYSDTSTLIDGAKHNNDNFIISKILFSTSQEQVVNLSRLAVETYVDSNYSVVANRLFTNKENPKKLLNALKSPDFKLPSKTRDIYLYMPYRMMNIFPTIGVFGNLDLTTGRRERNIIFYPTVAIKQSGTKIFFQNGIVFDTSKGTIKLGKFTQKVYHFDQVKLDKNFKPKVQKSILHLDGKFCIVHLVSYGKVIIMDRETYNSAYIQMFMLGNYDKNLFELVVSSPYSKIYKIKR
jgi:dolichyl-diphosphooligosaccharide--protein glycosyltransferase/undecaprenyl-diphosphooligosaccharide--protein glycosyltransferase